MVYWPKDIKKFDHSKTGYPLTFKHVKVECKKCHTQSLIKGIDIISWAKEYPQFDVLNRTFLGLSTICADCHNDIHQGELAQNCETCHTIEDWKLASDTFDHNRAKYQLTGAHKSVTCEKCHPVKTDSSPSIKQFKNLEFSNCIPCHNDTHKGSFGTTCDQCHTTIDWKKNQKPFDHATTNYPLIGKHQTVGCNQCHTPEMAGRNLQFEKCSSCHEDKHNGQLIHRTDKGECSVCHSENGFLPPMFTLDMHQTTRFVLDGSHIATPCNKCHVKQTTSSGKNDTRLYWPSLNCQSCHTDYHQGQFSQRLKGNDCTVCHSTGAWEELLFSHKDTKFPLIGKHTTAQCEACHKTKAFDKQLNDTYIIYSKTEKTCGGCHDDIHQEQFAQNRGNRCEECHTSISWKSLVFDHTTSAFPLDGKHKDVTCIQCHFNEVALNETKFIRYYPVAHKCADCHLLTKDIR